MIGIVGTVPDLQLPVIHGKVRLIDNHIEIQGRRIAVNRCTPALIGAALKASEFVDCPEIYAFLVGDIGRGDGSRKLYDFLVRYLHAFDFKVLTFHYLQPDVDWHNKVLFAVQKMQKRPILIADAGFMYAAKMSGESESYDFFTPDAGELAFLADELAPHPFYTRGFILHPNTNVLELIKQAYQHQNAARYLLVKGKSDYIVHEAQVVEKVDYPSFDTMEAIGGTGDTMAGVLSVLCGADFKLTDAAVLAARVNRWTGYYANPSPATQVSELIKKIPQALVKVLDEYNGKNTDEK
jgi:ADP-dependent NAD(P)H-hydrate dehydratase / NAD(P)H-hydrate epimerase